MIAYSPGVNSDTDPGIGQETGRPLPNIHLQAQRARLGLTQAEVAESLAALAWQHDRQRLGVDATMVSKWERGLKRPHKLYRQLLCEMYGTTEDRLGLRPQQASDPLDDAYGADVNRRRFLQGAAAVGLAAVTPAPSLDRLVRALDKPLVDPAAVAAYASIAAGQHEMYWMSPARPLYESTVSHLRLGLDLLRNTSGRDRQELAAGVAHSALLSGRLAFFDLAERPVAQRCLDVARDLVTESEDADLAAAVYGHMAFLPGFAGDRAGASDALAPAYRFGRRSGPRLRSWLHSVDAELAARTGDTKRAMAQTEQAGEALTSSGSDPAWLDFYDPAAFASFAGYVQLLAGDTRTAGATLEKALAELPISGTKQRSMVLLDLATARAATDPDQAVELTSRAVQILQTVWYPTAQDRFPALRKSLRDSPYREALEERLRPLATLAS